jgi:mRNA interferase RelE/StbE
MPGSKLYLIEYLDAVASTHIPNLPASIKKVIKRAIDERLTLDPIGFGKPLRYSLKGHRRLRVGDYRVVYRIEVETGTVVIVTIKHIKDSYA